MTTDHFQFEGVRWITVEAVAQCYTVQVEWVREVVSTGLLGESVERSGTLAITAAQLERVAKIVQLHFHLGVDLTGIEILLSRDY
jgi:MerR HTH family regulatory protein